MAFLPPVPLALKMVVERALGADRALSLALEGLCSLSSLYALQALSCPIRSILLAAFAGGRCRCRRPPSIDGP